MKKTLFTMILASILAFALLVTASAAIYDFPAKELNALGLFQGTGNSFELDAAPKRDAAITMLIRLLGLENEAKSGDHSHPFTDVPADNWAYPYVALAYEKGLTTGATATTFNPKGACTAQMYVTYVLRALGYSSAEGGDFKYADALDFGKTKGIVDDSILSGDFLRGGMVAVSYLGILAKPNGGDFATLLEKLVDSGAVTASAAAPVLERVKLFSKLSAINMGVSEGAASIAMATESVLSLTVRNENTLLGEHSELKIKMGENRSVTAAIKSTLPIGGDVGTIEVYIVDGVIYINDGKEKTKMPLDTAMSAVPGDVPVAANMEDLASVSLNPLFIVSGVIKAVEDNLSAYTVSFSKDFMDDVMSKALSIAMENMGSVEGMEEIASVLPNLNLKSLTISTDDASVKVYVDENNTVAKVSVAFKGSVKILGLPFASCEFETIVDVTAIGDDVAIDLPDDLATYVDATDATAPTDSTAA